MEVILLEKIRNLGTLGDKVKVKPGFARNFLIPKGKAVFANANNIAKFEQRRAELETRAAEKHTEALKRQAEINALPVITISAKTGEEGKLFGSITSRDIMEKLHKENVLVEKRDIRLPEGAIRLVGEYEVLIDLESDITATVKINIVGEG